MNPNAMVFLFALTDKLSMLDTVYALTGIVLFIFACMTWGDHSNPRRRTSAMFWLILSLVFAFGSLLPHWLTGVLILVMVALDGAGRVARGSYDEATGAEQAKQARRLGDKIFLPVLVIPVVTFGFAFAFSKLGLDVTRGALVPGGGTSMQPANRSAKRVRKPVCSDLMPR